MPSTIQTKANSGSPKRRSLSRQVLLETCQNPLLGILWRDGQAAVLNQAANVARICVEQKSTISFRAREEGSGRPLTIRDDAVGLPVQEVLYDSHPVHLKRRGQSHL